MTDPAILFVKPKAISAKDKKALQTAGVIVIEIDDPANAKFTRACAELSSTEMLAAAVKAIRHSENATKAFANAIMASLEAHGAPSAPGEGEPHG